MHLGKSILQLCHSKAVYLPVASALPVTCWRRTRGTSQDCHCFQISASIKVTWKLVQKVPGCVAEIQVWGGAQEFAFLVSSMVTLPWQLLYRTPLEQCGGSRSLFLFLRFISSDIKLSCFQLQITEIGLNNKGNLSPPTNCSSEV